MLAATLVSIHNLYMLLDLVRNARQAILSGSFESFSADFLLEWETGANSRPKS